IPQKPARPASGLVVFTVTDNIVVATDAVLQRADGIQYIVSAGGTLASTGTLSVPVVAATDGANTNADASTPLQIMSGVTTTSSTPPTCAVDGNRISLGVDVEDIESYRARIL